MNRPLEQLLKSDKPLIYISLRQPYDLAAFPDASTYAYTYSIMEPSMRAVAKAVFGHSEMMGRLPVSIPGLE